MGHPLNPRALPRRWAMGLPRPATSVPGRGPRTACCGPLDTPQPPSAGTRSGSTTRLVGTQ